MFFNLKTHIMSQKKFDNLGQTQPLQEQPDVIYQKSSIVDYLKSLGIPSNNITHEKLGQTTLMFTNRDKPPVDDDSLEASIRNLKFKRFNP
jgi:hypothetical protein